MKTRANIEGKSMFLSRITIGYIYVSFVLLFISINLSAKPVHTEQAQKACRGWLKTHTGPMKSQMASQFRTLTTYTDENQTSLYHVINLEPAGFVILSADDQIEPVIAFSETGRYEAQQGHPLKTLLEKDMKGRLEQVRQKKQEKSPSPANNKNRWDQLLRADDESDFQILGIGSVSDVRVEPFIESLWGQDTAAGGNCYNYYTPNNYVTGCVATAMAQVMRYHTWPQAGIGVHTFPIYVNGSQQFWNTRGGNGTGGPYNWSQMPLDPQAGLTATQRQAIGALCYDAGVAVNMSYNPLPTGSSASLADADSELANTFMYSNSVYGYGFPSAGSAPLWTIINTNLDAGLPVILGISRTGGGHAVIADGYGYSGSTPYHHINMGWDGTDNAWYNLPTIDAQIAQKTYTAIDDCIYNLYTSGTGEIISGRVTDLAGTGLTGAAVTAYIGSTPIQQATTTDSGVYALIKMSPNTQYRLSAVKTGYIFSDKYSTPGQSYDWNASTGNQWGVNFTAANASPPTAFDATVPAVSTSPVLITLQAADDNLPNPPAALTYTLTSLPTHGDLTEPGVGPITQVPYTLNANQVSYTPCPYYGGPDTFTFKAHDGGDPPSGGESNIAAVTVDVDNQLYADYGTSSNNYLYGMIIDTEMFYDARMQAIYTPAEIGSAKRITDFSIRIGEIPGRTLSNWTIRMQHTTKNYFQSAPYELLTSGWTTVYQNNWTMTQTGWVNFHLDTPFDYNGTQNLMIDFSYNNNGITSPKGGYFFQLAGTNRCYSVGSHTGGHGDPLLWDDYYGKYSSADNYLPSMKIIGTVPIDPIAGDFDLSCEVSLPDFGMFALAWQTAQGQPGYDADCDIALPKNNQIDLADLAAFTNHWLNRYP